MDTREALTALMEAGNRRDLDAAVAVVDPAAIGEVPSHMSAEPDVYDGHEGIRRYFQTFWDIVDDLTFQIVGFEDVGAWTLAAIHAHSFGRGSGLPIEANVAVSARSRDGKIVHLRSHHDLDEAREWAATASPH